MTISFTDKEFRRLLDMIYIGNWILNSARGTDRFRDYDLLQEKLFTQAAVHGMQSLTQLYRGHIFPSVAYVEGGIHEAIADYEDAVFFDILAEELARRDLEAEHLNPNDDEELTTRIEAYLSEFEKHGIDNISIDEA